MSQRMQTPAFADVLDARFKEIYYEVYDKVQTTYKSVVKIERSNRNYEYFGAVSGVGEFEKVDEGETTPLDNRTQDFDKSFTVAEYSNSVQISTRLLNDDLSGKMALGKNASSLAMSAQRFLDETAADMFNNGFTTTDKNGDPLLASDGIRIFSTVHYKNPDETGTTYSNASNTGLTLKEDNLETAINALRTQLNPRGKNMYCKPTDLIVPYELEKEANIILGSDKRSDTADNDMNVYKNMGINIVVWDNLGATFGGSDTAWFLIDRTVHQMMMIMREEPHFSLNSPIYHDRNRYYEWVMDFAFSFGVHGWRGLWGSKGDGAAYSS